MSALPRLLFCSFESLPAPTSLSRRLAEYVKGLSGRYEVVLLSTKHPERPHIELFHGARLLRVPDGGTSFFERVEAFERAVRRQLQSEEYQLAHFTDPFAGYALCELRKEHGFKLVYEAMHLPSLELAADPADPSFIDRVRQRELSCLASADLVITGSQTSCRYLAALGVTRSEPRMLPAAVDLQEYAATAAQAPAKTPMKALYLGSFASHQGLPTLLEAAARALEQVEFLLELAGPSDGPERGQLERLIEKLELSGKVTLAPPVPHSELPRLLASVDLGLAPLADLEQTRAFGGPLSKVAEYLAAGRAILATELPSTRELVPASCAHFVPAGDAEAIAGELVLFSRDAKLRTRLGAAARQQAEQHGGSHRVLERLVAFYSELIGALPQVDSERSGLRAEAGTPTSKVSAQAMTGPETIDDDEVKEADELAVELVGEPVLEAWFSQLAHGYCPPEGSQFARPPPPTNFPGKEGPAAAAQAPSTKSKAG